MNSPQSIRPALILIFLLTLSTRAVELPYRNEATRQLLLDALGDPDRVTRVQAIRDLASVPDPRNSAELERVSKDPVEAVRRQVAWGGDADPGAPPSEVFVPRPRVPADQVSDTHRDPRVRLEARLRKLQAEPAFKVDFSPLLQDPDYFVRRGVSTRVVEDRGKASLPVWRRLFGSDRSEDQVEAAWAVGRLNSKEDEAALIGLLGSDSERLRLMTITSLEGVGGGATRAALDGAIRGASGKTQEALIRLATKLSARPALPALRTVAGDAKAAAPSRLLAMDALGAMADPEAKPLLLELLKSNDAEDSNLREHEALALGALGATEATARLKSLITDKVIPIRMVGLCYESETTRIACLLALEQIQARAAIQSIQGRPFLEEAGENLRRALSEVLTRITGKPFDYRRDVVFRSHFLESLEAEEYPADLAENLKKPPVFEK